MATAKKAAPKSAKTATFTADERAAMKERAQEMKAAARRGRGGGKADGEGDVLAKIAAMPAPDRAICERLHAIIKANAPGLSPKTWYGMPAYANEDGKVVCFFRDRQKFKERYMTLGFNEDAHLDEGHLWPVAFALTELTAADEARIRELVKRAVG